MLTKEEKAIMNSWQIYQDLHQRSGAYRSPAKSHFVQRGRSGRVKIYSEEMIFVENMRRCASSLNNLTISLR